MSPFSKVVVAVGTYDGVLAGWELNANEKKKFKIAFATPVHEGSVRSIVMAQRHTEQHSSSKDEIPSSGDTTSFDQQQPGSLLSCGYDEVLRTHDFTKRLNSSGEVRTPAEFGTPVCSAFAPPMCLIHDNKSDESPPQGSTHCLVGFTEGKLVIYKKRDWSVQHVLAGHEGGVACIAVHPSGKMALTGGESDGKLKLWDLTKGRLSFVSKIKPAQAKGGKTQYEAVANIVWITTDNGEHAYAFCYGNHITVRDVAGGTDLLDVDLPSKVNQVCFLKVDEGLFVAAACNDGSLPVLAVENTDSEERRAIMAIEPVDGPVAGEERFKCIQSLVEGHVVTANSAGVVSLMDLRGAIRMMMADREEPSDDDDDAKEKGAETQDSDEESAEEDLAVDIIDAVQLGTGARVTVLAAWCCVQSETNQSDESSDSDNEEDISVEAPKENKLSKDEENAKKRSRPLEDRKVTIDDDALQRARALVKSAKKIQSRKVLKKKQKRGKSS
mmetsp:Transcript_8474/g.11163  ORF Transcript_8474/g.11163 Transcript_8474/m.11163 type:complete len:498 (+) Transcript_8474:99-1592(+)|eukprot:CAMPEP_0198142740 /NCGR_PEP_ID=MMETSP1443-20131203/5449_1 /TAXON_ID=186043 /ORGANISM="Entomoneis sp., Strain CCMP2396" /LENGTH=497 /DNA_ID=CAMNT_0043805823 /DNA_START=79 /DNA_END=1572 /DNA_ORIENTATION=+